MSSSLFAEDIFQLFFQLVDSGQVKVQHQDHSPVVSFYTKLLQQEPLTKNQADYVVKILEKYQHAATVAGLDYSASVKNFQWKQPFRILDLTKRIYVEQAVAGQLEVCVKFPYQLKKEFDDQINSYQLISTRFNNWDADQKLRRLNLYDFNLIALYEFANRNNFQIDDTFIDVLADVEEIWQNQEEILPVSDIINGRVQLINATAEAEQWFNLHYVGETGKDLLTAKHMGYSYRGQPKNVNEKIAAHSENGFWIRTNDKFFDLYKNITGKAAVVLDRTGDTLAWLQKFVADADTHSVNRDEIKVCFRDSKDRDTGINEWIKLAGVGGKVETGRLLIFESRPAKWLFKDQSDVTLLVTNNVFPPTNVMTRDWFNSHPCVIYLGDIKPSETKGQKIVEL
jgi:hypothetical protein